LKAYTDATAAADAAAAAAAAAAEVAAVTAADDADLILSPIRRRQNGYVFILQTKCSILSFCLHFRFSPYICLLQFDADLILSPI
jgi:hypothetical protein